VGKRDCKVVVNQLSGGVEAKANVWLAFKHTRTVPNGLLLLFRRDVETSNLFLPGDAGTLTITGYCIVDNLLT
jgi:hypothetical protein